jgi:hypothetical protein
MTSVEPYTNNNSFAHSKSREVILSELRSLYKQKCVDIPPNHIQENRLYLYSFYVFLAYTNRWDFIKRETLTKREVDIMKELGCYRFPRRYRGELKNL